MTALIFSKTKTFFQAADNAYRYWLSPARGEQHAVLKIQVKRALIAKFRASKIGQRLQDLVEIFEAGGGWYEIVARDLTSKTMLWIEDLRKTINAAVDAVKLWVREFNKAQISHVNANTVFTDFVVVHSDHRAIAKLADAQKTHRLETKVNQLAAKFGKAVAQ